MTLPRIRSARLELVSLSADVLDALLSQRHDDAATLVGVPAPPDWPRRQGGFLRLRLEQLRRDPASQPWLVRAVVLAGTRPAWIGSAGFHGPPGVNALRRPDAVELGYEIEPEHRRRGYATEAVEALVGWAHRDGGIRAFVASVAPDNEPSLALVRRLGFGHVGEHWDEEDGLELEFLLELDAREPA